MLPDSEYINAYLADSHPLNCIVLTKYIVLKTGRDGKL